MLIKCPRCAHFQTCNVSKFMRHLFLIHSSEPNFSITCGLQNCVRTFKKFTSYKSHVYRDHRDLQHKSLTNHRFNNLQNFDIQCLLCQEIIGDLTHLMTHLRFHIENGEEIQCIFDNCTRKYTVYNSLKSHVSRDHRGSTVSDLKDDFKILKDQNVNDGNENDEENFPNIFEDNVVEEDDQINDIDDGILNKVALFLLHLQECNMLPIKTVQEILEETSQLFDLHTCTIKKHVTDVLKKHNVNNEIMNDMQSIFDTDPFLRAFSQLKSDWLRKQYYKRELHFVEPVCYILGRDDEHKERTTQYIPVISSLKTLLRKDDVLSFVMNPTKTHEGILKDFCDGEFCKDNILFSNNRISLKLYLFFDEFEVVNPIGAHRKKHKIGGFYYILGNIPPEKRSVLNGIQLVMLCKSSDIKRFGLGNIIQPIIDDVKILETEGLVIESVNFPIKGTIAFISADNLGSHLLGGYPESFSPNVLHVCRSCL